MRDSVASDVSSHGPAVAAIENVSFNVETGKREVPWAYF
jgi:hypothetical protein